MDHADVLGENAQVVRLVGVCQIAAAQSLSRTESKLNPKTFKSKNPKSHRKLLTQSDLSALRKFSGASAQLYVMFNSIMRQCSRDLVLSVHSMRSLLLPYPECATTFVNLFSSGHGHRLILPGPECYPHSK